MVDFATLVLKADASGMVEGVQALDALAAKGAATEKAVTKAMDGIGASGKAAGKGMADADAAAKRTAAGMQQAATQAKKAGAEVNAASGYVANLTANFNDIAVMMAAGQSPIQLAMQQGTQITQVFTQLGGGVGALRAVGSAVMAMVSPLSLATLGIIALGGAASQWLMASGAEAKSLEDSFADLEGQIAALQEANDLAGQSAASMLAAYGNASPELRAVLTEMAGIERVKLHDSFDAITQSLDQMIQTASYARTAMGQGQDFLGLGSIGRTNRELGAEFANLREQLEGAADMGERLQAALNIRDFLLENVGAQEQMNGAQRQYYDGILAIISRLAMAGAATKDMAKYQADATAHIDAWRKAQTEAAKAAEDLVGTYDRQAAMSQAVAQYGADSAQVEAMKRDEAMRAAQALADQHVHAGNSANEIVRAALAAFDAATGADAAAVSLRNAEAAARALASAIAAAAGFSLNLDNQIAVIGARIAAQQAGADAAIAGQVKSLELQAEAQRDNSVANGEAAHIAEWRYQQDLQRIGQLGELTAQEKADAEAIRESAKASNAKGKGASGAASAAKKAAKEAEKLEKALDREAQQWRELLDPMAKYKRDLEDLGKLSAILSKDEMAEAQRRLNVELADSLPLAGDLVDTMVEGLGKGFKGTLSDLGGLFKKWILDQIAFAGKNRIIVGMTGQAGGMAGMAGQAAAGAPGMGGVGGAGGVLGGLTGAAGTLASSAIAGASGFLSAAAGGLGSAATYTGFMLKGATAGLAGFGSALGAIALPLAAVAAVFSFFKKKTKELDAGIRVTVDGMSTLVEEFRKTETKRFWGLSKKVRTSYDQADQETQDALSRVVGTLQAGVMDAAKVLGFGSATFRDFAHEMKVSTKGMSEEEALAAVQEAIGGLGDDFAGMIPGLTRLRLDGEGASDALLRLSQSLVGVNGIMDTLGHRFHAAGLSGADAASKIAEAFGGLDAMASATQRFYEGFYSDQERLTTTTRQTRKAVAELGLAMPKTRNEYRAMVAALDLTTKKGRETYAALIGMAEAFDLILPQVGALSAQLARLQGAVQTGLDGTIDAAETAAQANAKAAADWYKAAGSIREYIDRMRSTASALFNPQQALRYNRGEYQATLTRAKAGDLSAAQGLTGSADRYLSSVMATAKTREEAALAQARVLSDLGLMQGIGDIEGARHDVISGLLGQQVDLMKETRDFLANGGVLTDKMISELSGKLGGLDEAIKAAELINYQYLKEKLKVTVDVIADAKIPAHLKTLLANATNGVEGFVDFITRSDLAPDLKWLALNSASEHVKTISYLAKNNLGAGLTKVALDTVGTLQKTVNLLVGKKLPDDLLRVALAGSSELSRVVNVTLSSKSSEAAKKLALGNLGAYSVAVMASLDPKVSATVRRLVVSQQGSYAAMIEAAISGNMTDTARRILLTRQGGYIATITGALNANMSDTARRLLINATTKAARLVTISAAFDKGVTPAQKHLFDAIKGSATGKITLGGSFLFDPSKGFQTWFETSSKAAIATPMAALKGAMGTLQSALGKLQAAIAAETKRAARQDAIGRLNTYVGSLTANKAGNHFVDDTDLAKMAKIVGLNTEGLNPDQIRSRLANFDYGDRLKGTVYDPKGTQEKAYLDSLKPEPAAPKPAAPKAYTIDDYKLVGGYTLGGSEGMGYAYMVKGPLGGTKTFQDPMGGTSWQDFIKGQKFPAFATGGRHAGGLRIVGEKGPELEATGPSRIFSNSQTRDLFGNREMLAELKALRAEMAEMKAHARRSTDSAVQTEKTLKRMDALGVKIDPDQNKVTA